MSKSDLQNWLISNPGFRRIYSDTLVRSVATQFPSLDSRSTVERPEWPYLLFCGSILADSPRAECQEIALRVAQACVADPEAHSDEKDTAALVLDDLANRVAVDLSITRELIKPQLPSRLGSLTRIEWTRRSLENSIVLADQKTTIIANRFQKQFWNAVRDNTWTSTSAPTSAGKLFIILQAIGDYFQVHKTATIAYIVPTRALIHQVETDFRELRKIRRIQDINISSIPLSSMFSAEKANFMVFTQERLHLFLSAFDQPPKIDVMVVDEAHKLGDGSRGVLLQEVIERVAIANPSVQVIFASPQTENPEVLLSDAPEGARTKAIKSEDITVNQNLIWASQAPRKPKIWKLSLLSSGELHHLGTLELLFTPSVGKRLPFIAHALGANGGGNLVYVDGAADAENAAALLFDLIGQEADISSNPQIRDLAELIKSAIHDDYALAYVIQRGVAFHYGNMPLIIRSAIENAFKGGLLSFLVCTSTLVEGVNLPCRNIFVRGPKKGRGKPMNDADFWNLAGRAGRWGREFQGNIICVDATNENVWRNGAPKGRSRYRIERATDRALDEFDAVVLFLSAGMPPQSIVAQPELEYMGAYFIACTIRFGSIANTPFSVRLSPEQRSTLESTLATLVSTLDIDHEIILRNPGISPVAMDRLLKYFADRDGPPEELLPVAPTSEDAVQQYVRIFGRINRHVSSVFGTTGRTFMLAMLVVSWMRGHPLKRLISERWAYVSGRGIPKTISAVIRETMKDVEEFARFQAPKFVSCYVDVLKQHLRHIERTDLITSDLDVNVLLEFGVPGGTQLSLMGLGMSRTSALALAEFIAADDLTETLCIIWLNQNNWRVLNLPNLVKHEIEFVLKMAS